jgi:hypothetical protein
LPGSRYAALRASHTGGADGATHLSPLNRSWGSPAKPASRGRPHSSVIRRTRMDVLSFAPGQPFCGGSRTGLKCSISRPFEHWGSTRRRLWHRLPVSKPLSAAVGQWANGQDAHLRPPTAGCRVRPPTEDSRGAKEARRAGAAGSRGHSRRRAHGVNLVRSGG